MMKASLNVLGFAVDNPGQLGPVLKDALHLIARL